MLITDPAAKSIKDVIRPVVAEWRTLSNVSVADLTDWLNKQTIYQWLLAHCYDGVIWGKWDAEANQWLITGPLLAGDLLQLRLFGEKGELFLWRDEGTGQLRGRALGDQLNLGDEQQGNYEYFDEPQILWGTNREKGTAPEGFSILSDGQEGLIHTVPLDVSDQYFNAERNYRPIRLIQRHYISRDERTGLAQITLSRLLDLRLQTLAEAQP